MINNSLHIRLVAGLGVALLTSNARAASWTLWADDSNGIKPANFPQIAISPQREIFLTQLVPQQGPSGVVYRATLDDPQFVQMPGFPLPTPAMGKGYNNVFAMTTTAKGAPVVGLSANGSSMNTDPMLMTWDPQSDAWFAPTINPPGEVCAHNLYILERAPNGDVWAGCQWHGAYRSMDDGKSFDYVDVSKLVGVSTPGYYPTRASGAGDLGALYGLHIGPDGTVYFGTETGGVVYSSDRGATFRPLDAAPNDPMSSMARATNSGNVGGLGVTPDGRILVQGVAGTAPYPEPDMVRFWVFDTAARTMTLGIGFPDYFLAGQQVTQIVTMPSGEMFMHTNRPTVDEMTGMPTLGGIMRSTDGVTWAVANDGIDETFMVPNMNVWIDGNGERLGRAFAVDGDDLYTVTQTGKIFVLHTVPQEGGSSSGGGGEDTGDSAGSTGGGSSGGNGGSGSGGGSEGGDSAVPTGGGSEGGNGGSSSGGNGGSTGTSEADGARAAAAVAVAGPRRGARRCCCSGSRGCAVADAESWVGGCTPREAGPSIG